MHLADFRSAQKALIEKFSSDPSVHDLPRVMRLPGFIHCKVKDGIASEPFCTRIIKAEYGMPYPASIFVPPDAPRDKPPRAKSQGHKASEVSEPESEADSCNTEQRARMEEECDRFAGLGVSFSFWDLDINSAAMENLSLSVPVLFPTARVTASGGYRVASTNLNNMQDLSIAPEGIKNFGVHDMGDPREGKRTPIELVMEWDDKDEAEATAWLAQTLGIEWEADRRKLSPRQSNSLRRCRPAFARVPHIMVVRCCGYSTPTMLSTGAAEVRSAIHYHRTKTCAPLNPFKYQQLFASITSAHLV